MIVSKWSMRLPDTATYSFDESNAMDMTTYIHLAACIATQKDW